MTAPGSAANPGPAGASGRSAPIVIQTEELDGVCRDWLSERCRVVECAPDDPRLNGLLGEAAGLVVRTYTKVNRGLLDRAPRLKVVGRAGVGIDNIDVAACRARGIEVVHTPDANTQAVVELVTAFMLDALRPRRLLTEPLDSGAWRRERAGLVAPRQLSELSLGILGLGRVGKGVARVAGAIGMRVIYNDVIEIAPEKRAGAAPVAQKELFSSADVLSVHIDDRPGNRGFVSAELIGLLKPDAILINTSRGFVVDTPALGAWLRRDPSAQAFVDVHEPEPIPAGYPLLDLPNARLTPHIGAATAAAHRNMSWVVRDVWLVLSGEKPQFPAPR